MPAQIEVTEQDRAEAKKVHLSNCLCKLSGCGTCVDHQNVAAGLARARQEAVELAGENYHIALDTSVEALLARCERAEAELAGCLADMVALLDAVVSQTPDRNRTVNDLWLKYKTPAAMEAAEPAVKPEPEASEERSYADVLQERWMEEGRP